MNLDLHGVFAAEGTVLPFEQSLDLSDLDFKGTYPLKQPAVISGTVENHAGVVQLDAVIQYLCGAGGTDDSFARFSCSSAATQPGRQRRLCCGRR